MSLVNLSIPAAARGGMLGLGAPIEQEQEILTVSTHYTESSNPPHTSDIVQCKVTRLNSGFDDVSSKDLSVDAQINKCTSIQATKDALASADMGRFDQATSTIRNALSTIRASSSFATGNNIVLAAVEDLEDALRAVSNRSQYERGGRAEMTEGWSKSSAQRSHYKREGKFQHINRHSLLSVSKRLLHRNRRKNEKKW